jgi:BtpA family.
VRCYFIPLLGFYGFEGFEKILDNAIKDARALEEGSIDGINCITYPC